MLLLEICIPSYRAAEVVGGVQVDLHVFSMQVSEGNLCYGTLSLLHLCQKSHHLIGDHKATQWQNKAQSTEAELIKHTDFLFSRWKIPYW